MIAEVTKVFRRLTSPLRRSFWWRRPQDTVDAPGVLLVSFPAATSAERQKILSKYSHYRRQALIDSARPLEPENGELPSLPYRCFLFTTRSLIFCRQLFMGALPWSVHLCESENLALVHQELLSGRSVIHLNDLRPSRIRDLRRLERSIAHLEHRRYECWLVFRDRKEAFVPASLAFPEEPLSGRELEELAQVRSHPEPQPAQLKQLSPQPGTLRVMSYNVHSCIGLDGRLSVRRIAEVLEKYSPHLVALQELDQGCRRSGGLDQLQELARLWPSTPFFSPTLKKNGGHYGIGCLSRLPVSHRESAMLSLGGRGEPRAAQVLDCEWPDGKTLRLVNTHLGLSRVGRLSQLQKLAPLLDGCKNVILAGDINASPNGPEHRFLTARLEETQAVPKRTWFGSYPIRVLDYTLFRGDLQVLRSIVPQDGLTRTASDHLPLITDFKVL